MNGLIRMTSFLDVPLSETIDDFCSRNTFDHYCQLRPKGKKHDTNDNNQNTRPKDNNSLLKNRPMKRLQR